VSGNPCSGICTVCGDGLTDLGEECDDGNVLESDACGATCLAVPCGVVPPGTLVLERGLPGLLTLTWAPSCLATDDDFAVYRGVLGDFDSHLAVACSTSGVESASLPLPVEDSYFLVVPRNTYSEGSYGSAAAGERPPSQLPCAAQKLTSCR
jgi:cysteine-rich repeat protein